MKRNHHLLAWSAAVALFAAACGGHRPPVVSKTPGQTRPTPAPPPSLPSQPVDAGPGINPVDRDSPGVSEGFPGIDSSEASPLSDVHFGFNDAKLSEQARATLEKHAEWLQGRRDVKVKIEGHCDERGTVEYNLALGAQRAKAALDYLTRLGVAADRLTPVSFGKEKPLDSGHSEEAWAKNRRAHFAVYR